MHIHPPELRACGLREERPTRRLAETFIPMHVYPIVQKPETAWEQEHLIDERLDFARMLRRESNLVNFSVLLLKICVTTNSSQSKYHEGSRGLLAGLGELTAENMPVLSLCQYFELTHVTAQLKCPLNCSVKMSAC